MSRLSILLSLASLLFPIDSVVAQQLVAHFYCTSGSGTITRDGRPSGSGGMTFDVYLYSNNQAQARGILNSQIPFVGNYTWRKHQGYDDQGNPSEMLSFAGTMQGLSAGTNLPQLPHNFTGALGNIDGYPTLSYQATDTTGGGYILCAPPELIQQRR